MTVALDDRDRELLGGRAGDGAALAMRLVVRAADALGAERLIPITRAHVDSCLYHGQASLDFAAAGRWQGARERANHPERGSRRPPPSGAVAG